MLGGSSVLNYMLYVRGNKRDYNRWAAEGADGWAWKDVFPYFLKSEDNRDESIASNGEYFLVRNKAECALSRATQFSSRASSRQLFVSSSLVSRFVHTS